MSAAIALLTIRVAMLGAYALVAYALRGRRAKLVLHRLHGAGHIAIALGGGRLRGAATTSGGEFAAC